MCNVFASLEPDHSVIILISDHMVALVMVSNHAVLRPNLLSFKQRATENSLKSILFFAQGFKDEMINFKCISWGYQWGLLIDEVWPLNLTVREF